jgi:hypothetical protein
LTAILPSHTSRLATYTSRCVGGGGYDVVAGCMYELHALRVAAGVISPGKENVRTS